MPYSVKKSGGGYKVHSPGRTYSKKPMSKARSGRQLAAIKMSTNESDEDMAHASHGEETRAVRDYGQRARSARDPDLKRVFLHAKGEEEEHASELKRWMDEAIPDPRDLEWQDIVVPEPEIRQPEPEPERAPPLDLDPDAFGWGFPRGGARKYDRPLVNGLQRESAEGVSGLSWTQSVEEVSPEELAQLRRAFGDDEYTQGPRISWQARGTLGMYHIWKRSGDSPIVVKTRMSGGETESQLSGGWYWGLYNTGDRNEPYSTDERGRPQRGMFGVSHGFRDAQRAAEEMERGIEMGKYPLKKRDLPLMNSLYRFGGRLDESAEDIPDPEENEHLPDPEEEGEEFVKTAPVHAVQMDEPFEVETIEGEMEGKADDWLVKGHNGDMWVVDDEMFRDTHKPAGPEHEPLVQDQPAHPSDYEAGDDAERECQVGMAQDDTLASIINTLYHHTGEEGESESAPDVVMRLSKFYDDEHGGSADHRGDTGPEDEANMVLLPTVHEMFGEETMPHKTEFAPEPDPESYQTFKSPKGYHVLTPSGNEQWFPTKELRDRYLTWHRSLEDNRRHPVREVDPVGLEGPKLERVFRIGEAPVQNRPPPGSQPVRPTDWNQLGQRGQALKQGMTALQGAGQEMTPYKTPQGDTVAFPKDAAPGRGPVKADLTKGVWSPMTGSQGAGTGTPFTNQAPATTMK